MKSLTKIPALLLALSATLAPALAQDTDASLDTVFGDHETFHDAFDALKLAVQLSDAETVASLVRYPFPITIDGERYVLDSEDEFSDRYEDIFTPALAAVVTDQNYADLMVNQDGVMFGAGELWMAPVCLGKSCERSWWLIEAIAIPE